MTPTAYRIKDVAERSGFSAATLRYYEDIGLLPPAQRTAAGYRTYDDAALDRLAFIARAKQLGCTLDEIADLATAWDGGRCGPVQDRLRTVVAAKRADAQRQIAELMALTGDLQRAGVSLERHRPDGPCDDTCGCVSDPVAPAASPISPTVQPVPADSVAISCSLERGALPGRIDEWQTVLAHVVSREPLHGGVRAVFHSAVPADDLIRLAAAEQDCCRFLSFAITIDPRGIALEVTAPAEAVDIVHALFGAPT